MRFEDDEPEVVGLNAFVFDEFESVPIMRAIAKCAIKRKLSLGALAKRWNELANSNLNPSNIRRHFASSNPKRATIERYAKILGLPVNDLYVMAGETELSGARVDREIGNVRLLLSTVSPDFEEHAISDAFRTLDEADNSRLRTIATRHWLASQDVLSESVIVEVFNGIVDLAGSRLNISSNENFLFGLWSSLLQHSFPSEDADAMVALAVGLLHRRGIDVSLMERRLQREKKAKAKFLQTR